MDTRDLKAFLAVYEQRNISSAAKTQFITAQGLSKLIKKLETELDVELFLRNAHGVEPTAYGDILYQNAKDIMGVLEHVKAGIRDKGDKKAADMKLISTFGALEYLTIDFLMDFKDAYPGINLNFQEYPDKDVDQKLWNDEAEIGFIAGPVDTSRYHAVMLTNHHHCLVINKRHPLARKEKITYKDLDGEPIALEGRNFVVLNNIVNTILMAGGTPNIVMETTEVILVNKIARMNKGIGISVDFVALNSQSPETVVKPFADPTYWTTYLIYKKGRILSKEAERFKDFTLTWIKQNSTKLFKWDI